MSLRVFHDLDALSHAAAEFVVRRSREAIETHGRFTLGLAGGNTPKRLYQLLAAEPYRDYIEWHKTLFFFGDERFVPPSDPASNEGMAREALLDHVPVTPSQIFSMFREGISAQEAAGEYEKILRSEVGPNCCLDLILLGMGDDGHTASLFPGIPELAETSRLVVPTISPKGVPQRLSFTVPALTGADALLFLVAGGDKNEPLRRALGDDNAVRPPSGVIAKAAKRAVWYTDEAAAAGLSDGALV